MTDDWPRACSSAIGRYVERLGRSLSRQEINAFVAGFGSSVGLAPGWERDGSSAVAFGALDRESLEQSAYAWYRAARNAQAQVQRHGEIYPILATVIEEALDKIGRRSDRPLHEQLRQAVDAIVSERAELARRCETLLFEAQEIAGRIESIKTESDLRRAKLERAQQVARRLHHLHASGLSQTRDDAYGHAADMVDAALKGDETP